jgi:hypothetical protein
MTGTGTDHSIGLYADINNVGGVGLEFYIGGTATSKRSLVLDSSQNATFAKNVKSASSELATEVIKKAWGGSTVGNQTLSIALGAIEPQSTLKISAAFSHYGAAFSSYGCAKGGIYNCYSNSIAEINYVNTSSANGGAWTFSLSGGELTISKSAGTYGGGGYYIVTVEGYI